VDSSSTSKDHDTTENDGTDNTPEENPVLGFLAVYLEVLENQVKCEQVVQ